jgi:cell division septum initiation protein DivIVA
MLGWIFGGLVKKFERASRDVSRDFVKSSGREIDRLFDDKLNPLADKFDYMGQQWISQARREAEELETKTKDDIELLINQADGQAKEILVTINQMREEAILDLNKTVGEKVVQADKALENRINQISLVVMESLISTNKLAQDTIRDINLLEDKLFQDANYLIDRVEEVVDKTLEQVRMELKKYIGNPLPGVFDKCKRRLNIHWKAGHQISDIELYRLAECYELSKLNENTPIKSVLEIYGQLQLNAARMAALTRNAPALKKIIVEDWIKYGVLCEFWYDTMKTYDSNLPLLKSEIFPKLLMGEDGYDQK